MKRLRGMSSLSLIAFIGVVLAGAWFVTQGGGFPGMPAPAGSASSTAPAAGTELIGEWSLYLDCPNTVFTFAAGGTATLYGCDGDYQTTQDERGTYTVDGATVRATFPGSGTQVLTMVEAGGQTKLRLRNQYGEFLFFRAE